MNYLKSISTGCNFSAISAIFVTPHCACGAQQKENLIGFGIQPWGGFSKVTPPGGVVEADAVSFFEVKERMSHTFLALLCFPHQLPPR